MFAFLYHEMYCRLPVKEFYRREGVMVRVTRGPDSPPLLLLLLLLPLLLLEVVLILCSTIQDISRPVNVVSHGR